MVTEQLYLGLSLACYGGAALSLVLDRPPLVGASERRVLWLAVIAVVLSGGAVAERWLRTGQGPFLTLFDVLLSNIFSLGLIFTLAYWLLPAVRPAALVAVPLLALLTVWSLYASPEPVPLPPTYEHPWLWIHVLTGKFFLGGCLLACSLALLLLTNRQRIEELQQNLLDGWIWRFLAGAFVFQSLMLVAGAVWASDAWGRYWAWDPLETWALLNWLTLAALLHARVTLRLPDRLAWLGSIVVFVLAFLTFFGVPFINRTPHQGII